MKIGSIKENPVNLSIEQIVKQLIQLCQDESVIDISKRSKEIQYEIDKVLESYRKNLERLNKAQQFSKKIKDKLEEIKNKNEKERERLIIELGSEI